MSDIEWTDPSRNTPCDAGISFPCRGEYGWRRHRDPCPFPDKDHGHLHLSDEELTGRMPFCIRSQEGARKLLELLVAKGTLDQTEADAVTGLEAFKRLPVPITGDETAALADPEPHIRCVLFG